MKITSVHQASTTYYGCTLKCEPATHFVLRFASAGSKGSTNKLKRQINRERESAMCMLQMHVQCSDRFFEVSPDEVENAELTVEDGVSRVLLDLFGEGAVDDVAICFTSSPPVGLHHCSIHIHAQCFCHSFVLLPHTEENMKRAVEKSMCALLRELFGSVNVESVTFSPSPWDYEIDPALSYST